MNISLSAFLDIAIGLILIYSSLSLLASEIQELFSSWGKWRPKHLRKSIYLMIGGDKVYSRLEQKFNHQTSAEITIKSLEEDKAINLTNKIYQHPLVVSLSQSPLGQKFLGVNLPESGWGGPSYIDPEIFAIALIDILSEYSQQNLWQSGSILDKIITDFQQKIDPDGEININNDSKLNILPKNLQQSIYDLAIRSKLKLQTNKEKKEEIYQFQQEIEDWFSRSQNRTSGTYKRNAKLTLLTLGFLTAILANVNTFEVINSLYNQGTLREAVTHIAFNVVDQCQAENLSNCGDQINSVLDVNQLPIGWDSLEDIPQALFSPYNLLGWAITGFAITMGAPFWFELLNKYVNVRNAGPKPSSTK